MTLLTAYLHQNLDEAALHHHKPKTAFSGSNVNAPQHYLLDRRPSETGHVDDEHHFASEVGQRNNPPVQSLCGEIIDAFISHTSASKNTRL